MGKEFQESLDTLFAKVDDLVSTKTVVGDAIQIGDLTLLPLIDVSVGVGLGVGDENHQKNGAAGGMGAKIMPTAVLAIQNGSVQMINIKNQDAVSKLIDMAPGVVNKLNFSSIFSHDKKEAPEETVKFEEETIVSED